VKLSLLGQSVFFYVTCLVALILTILPFPPKVTLFLPLWIPLLLIYWVMSWPEKPYFILASLLGFCLDALFGTYFGTHSLALCLLVFIGYRFQLRFPLFPLMQQLIFIFILLVGYQLILFLIDRSLGGNTPFYESGVTILSSVLVWPFLKVLLKPITPPLC
jgi:rod shape-determining protein MreD